MPRSKSGVKRPAVDVDALRRAVEEVVDNGKSMYTAANMFNVSKTTLMRHIAKHKASNHSDFVYESRINHRQIFSPEEEDLLAKYVIQASKLHYGLPRAELKKLAFNFAEKNNKTIPKNWFEQGAAGRNWLTLFLQRHQTIALRKPEATSLSRATSFNEANVKTFFRNYKDCLSRYRFTPELIFNIDETGR